MSESAEGGQPNPLGSFELPKAPQGNNAVTHHLLPDSLSPTMDLALVFTTTRPSNANTASATAGAVGSQANAPNLAGLSAAQRLIQQRMAMMRARAAAAAGKPGPSSVGGSDSSSGSLKGASIEMTLYRVNTESDPVWKQSIKIPDVLFDDIKPSKDGKGPGDPTEKECETTRVTGMQYSLDGRTIALHVHVIRSQLDLEKVNSSISLVAVYSIQGGNLLALVPLTSHPNLTSAVHSNLSWIRLPRQRRSRLGNTSKSSGTAAQNISVSAANTISIASSFVSSTGSAGTGSGGAGGGGGAGARFQHLMGGSGGADTSNKASVLPSQRGLIAETPAKAGRRPGEDLLRGWTSLDSDEQDTGDCLLVPSQDDQGRPGVALLYQGRVYFAFVPVVDTLQSMSAMSHVARAWLQDGQMRAIVLDKGSSPSFQLQMFSSSPRFLSCPKTLSSLESILKLSSAMSRTCANALDLVHLSQSVYQTLKTFTQPGPSTLSTHQVTSLPPLTRFIYTLSCVAQNFSQDISNHLVLSICDGNPTEMIETLLLNALVDGKSTAMQSEIKTVYEVLEGVTSELSRVLDHLGTLLQELQGWTRWFDRVQGFFPSDINSTSLEDHLSKQFTILKHLRNLSHQVICYSQGERLAWDEWLKWSSWERSRLESLKTSNNDPMDPKTFDPLVVIELVQRGFGSGELDWILCEKKKEIVKPKRNDNDEDISHGDEQQDEDDTEQSFVKPEQKEKDASTDATDVAISDSSQVELPASLLNDNTVPDGAMQSKLAETISWLQPGSQANSKRKTQVPNSTPYHRLFQEGPASHSDHRQDVYTMTPHATPYYMTALTQGIKDIFMGMPERLTESSQQDRQLIAEISTSDIDVKGSQDGMGVVSLPVPLTARSTSELDLFKLLQRHIQVALLNGHNDNGEEIISLARVVINHSELRAVHTVDLTGQRINCSSATLNNLNQSDKIQLLDSQRILGCSGATMRLISLDGEITEAKEEGPAANEENLDISYSHGRQLLALIDRQKGSATTDDANSVEANGAIVWESQTLKFLDVKMT
ncbi:unnamed protein product [Sympodiomycopsis kandeliae]